jgi:peptidyl-prolyl cis-trans isomerase SurA
MRQLYVAILIAVCLPVLTTSASATAAAELIDRIVAVVNEDIILLSELNERMAPYVQRIRQQGFELDEERRMLFKIREEMINRMVDEKLTDQEIKRYDIQVDETDIDNTIERMKVANAFTDEDLRRFLQNEGLTLEQYRQRIKEQVQRTRLVNYQVKSKIVVTDEEITAYYDNHLDVYGGKLHYHLRNILMRPAGFATADEKRGLYEQMEQLRQRVESGESFAELARQFSQSPAAADGGDIGEFEKETFSPQIQDALDGLEAGQVTAVLDTDQGFQLFFVEKIYRSEGKPLDSVRAEIHQKLFTEVVDKKFLSWLEALRTQSHIKIIN